MTHCSNFFSFTMLSSHLIKKYKRIMSIKAGHKKKQRTLIYLFPFSFFYSHNPIAFQKVSFCNAAKYNSRQTYNAAVKKML